MEKNFDEAVRMLYQVRRWLIWASCRLTDEAYECEGNRSGMAFDLGFMAEDIDFALHLLGGPCSVDYDFSTVEEEGAEIERRSLRVRDRGRRWL